MAKQAKNQGKKKGNSVRRGLLLVILITFSLIALAELAGRQIIYWWGAFKAMNTITYSP